MFFYLKMSRNLIIGIFSFFNHRISVIENRRTAVSYALCKCITPIFANCKFFGEIFVRLYN